MKTSNEDRGWRMTSYEFYKKLDVYLEKRVEEVYSKRENLYNTNRKHLEALYDSTLTRNIIVKREKSVQLISTDNDFWENWCLQPHPFEEIVFVSLINIIYGTGYACITYMCCNNAFTDQQLKDLVFIYSGFFGFGYWEDEYVDIVCKWVSKGRKENVYGEVIKYIDDKNCEFKREVTRQVSLADHRRNLEIGNLVEKIDTLKNVEPSSRKFIKNVNDMITIVEKITSNLHFNERDKEKLYRYMTDINLECEKYFSKQYRPTDRRVESPLERNPLITLNAVFDSMPKMENGKGSIKSADVRYREYITKFWTFIKTGISEELRKRIVSAESDIRHSKSAIVTKTKMLEKVEKIDPTITMDDRLDWYGMKISKLSEECIRYFDKQFKADALFHKQQEQNQRDM